MKKILIRGVLGSVFILCMNQYLAYRGISVSVGMNGVTFLTTGTLGFPGAMLLYGIMVFGLL